MILESFRVTNFRSINSSGDIKVSRITALLGRNESGKSNLLRTLQSLNPADGFAALNPIKDFPRHRRLEECKPDTPVVSSTWKLTNEERKELAAILLRAASVKGASRLALAAMLTRKLTLRHAIIRFHNSMKLIRQRQGLAGL